MELLHIMKLMWMLCKDFVGQVSERNSESCSLHFILTVRNSRECQYTVYDYHSMMRLTQRSVDRSQTVVAIKAQFRGK